jgi:type IV pilus assembly protein PilQ
LQTTITKVPFFGDIPFLGVLFRNNTRIDNKTELLVFITPRIVEDRLGQR